MHVRLGAGRARARVYVRIAAARARVSISISGAASAVTRLSRVGPVLIPNFAGVFVCEQREEAPTSAKKKLDECGRAGGDQCAPKRVRDADAMTGSRSRPAILVAGLFLALLAVALQGVQGEELDTVPSEDQCRPYIERALKDLGTEGSEDHVSAEAEELGGESAADTNENDEESGSRVKRNVSGEEEEEEEEAVTGEEGDQSENEVDQVETIEIVSAEAEADGGSVELAEGGDSATNSNEQEDKLKEDNAEVKGSQEEQPTDGGSEGESAETKAEEEVVVERSEEQKAVDETYEESSEKTDSLNDNVESGEQKTEEAEASEERAKSDEDETASVEGEAAESIELTERTVESQEETASEEQKEKSEETEATQEQTGESKEVEATEEQKEESKEVEASEEQKEESKEAEATEEQKEGSGEDKKPVEEEVVSTEAAASVELEPENVEVSKETEETAKSQEAETIEGDESKEAEGAGKSEETGDVTAEEDQSKAEEEIEAATEKESGESDEESRPEEEELIMEIEIPEVLRPREHINQLLKLDEENEEKEKAVEHVADVVLKDLKRLYDNAIKPLETLYKYRDLSNRHFGDPEIFSKPLVLFMGPWSGGKSSIINYLLDIEYKPTNLRTGAEPSPAYFNILMHGEEEEILDGTQLAADWTFSGLQKFGQGLLDRLKGYKLNNKLLEKVNIVEIPGILEIRKQVQRLFPFNDACQWFIDRADIIFLVYDPAKLDVGPETEAILDQLKGREYQTRIVLNKADQVKPEELMRVQGALIWNISPLMSSAEPPVMYSASLWSIPYEAGAPTRLLYAQERALLRDLRSAIDKRVEHKIASARRFAVRVRNHAKMVDCYLTTYYNHKSFFAKKKDTSDRIIENPQDYHIYEGLSTLTNISRYDLPDPDVYRDFFRLNDLYEFPLLSTTCTYFRGCPINRLDIAIAYDLPELVGKYKKSAEAAQHTEEPSNPPAATSAPDAQNQQQQKPAARSGASRVSMS